MNCKVYILKSYRKYKTKQILFKQSTSIIEKQEILVYYTTSSTEYIANRNFGVKLRTFCPRTLFLIIHESLYVLKIFEYEASVKFL